MMRDFTQALAISGVVALVLSATGAKAYTEKTLYKFCTDQKCMDGIGPLNVVMDQAGNLFGTTSVGPRYGRNNAGYGVVYEFTPATGTYQVLYTFCSQPNCADGKYPEWVKLVIDIHGNLYGTTSDGGAPFPDHNGVVFELIKKKASWEYKVLHTFCAKKNCKDEGIPRNGLTYAGAATGTLYDGTSPLFGVTTPLQLGTVFEIAPKKGAKWSLRTIYTFCSQQNCIDGSEPIQPLTVDGAGNIFGTTDLGGSADKGTVFELSPAGNGSYTFSVLHSFCAQEDCTDGEEPFSSSPLIMDGSGDLVGTAGGGEKGDGVIYELTPQNGGGWQYNVLTNFDKKNAGPTSLILGNDGSLFGTTSEGGQGNWGTVFQYSGGTVQTIYNVCQVHKCPEGARPYDMIQDSSGNLFGTNEIGGIKNSGTLFELVNDKPAHHTAK